MNRPPGGRGRKVLAVSVSVLALGGIVVGLVLLARPPTVRERADGFRSAWAAGPLDEVQVFLDRGYWGKKRTQITGVFEQRGWLGRRPALGAAEWVVEKESVATVRFPLGSQTVTAIWKKADDTWRITKLSVPKYVEADDPPAPEARAALAGVLGTFLIAWNAGDREAVEALAEGAEVTEALRGRPFDEIFEDPTVNFRSRLEAQVSSPFRARGTLVTTWRWREGAWVLRRFRAARR